MATKKLVPDSLRSNEAFSRDLKELLTLTADQLSGLNRLATESPDGFSASLQAAPVAAETGVTLEKARRAILIADFLYERSRTQRIGVDDAVQHLADIAPELGITDIDDKTEALLALLSPKELYETGGYSKMQARSVIAHFLDIDGVWDIRPVFHRETGKVTKELAVLLLSVSWHDDVGVSHNATFQLDENDWASFQEKMKELVAQRQALSEYQERL